MAIPTVTSIAPTAGAPTGGQLVEVIGTGFQLPPPPPPSVSPVPIPGPSVRVLFGGVEGEVFVISGTRLYVRTPKRAMPVSDQITLGTEVVDIVVENIDSLGVLIPGETVTVVDAYTYNRPGITSPESGNLVRVVRTLIDLLRSELLDNTMLDTSSDYDPDTGYPLIPVETTPQLILTGPEIIFNDFFTYRGEYDVPGAVLGESFQRRRHRVVDLTFDVMGVTNSQVELINLMELFEVVIDRNVDLQFQCDALDPAQGFIPIELRILKSPTYDRADQHLKSNLRVFHASVQLRGFPFERLPGVDQDNMAGVSAEVADIIVEAPDQIGENLPAAQGATWRSPPNQGSHITQPPQGATTRSPPERDVPSPPPFPPNGGPTRSPPDKGTSE